MELVYFCNQYGENQEKIKNGLPTDKIKADIKLIEDTAEETAPELKTSLLLNVTDGKVYGEGEADKNIFNACRRMFFIKLNEKKSFI